MTQAFYTAFNIAAAGIKPVAATLCVLLFVCSFSLRAHAWAPAPVRSDSLGISVTLADDRQPNNAFAVKTNLLFHALSMLNAEVEVPVGRRFSILAEEVFPWWETGFRYCLQHLELGAEGRLWFRRWDNVGIEKLTGPFVGVYGMSAKYDFQYDTDLDYQGEYWSAGITGGWSFNLGRQNPWGRLELSLGAGYLRTHYRSYLPTDVYDRLIRNPYKTGVAQYVGPTKAKVSIVIPVNFKVRKREVSHD